MPSDTKAERKKNKLIGKAFPNKAAAKAAIKASRKKKK